MHHSLSSSPQAEASPGQNVQHVTETTCCIVGGGPAGAILALLLARKAVPVILLEAHKDFEREFRADTIHPATMELLEKLGIVDSLLQMPHTKMKGMKFITDRGKNSFTIADFSRLRTRYPYLMMLPQARFLELVTQEAERYPNFQLVMGARVEQLIEEDGAIRGVLYRGSDGLCEVRALLTVGADGRFSRTRQQAQMEMMTLSAPLEMLWFNLPRKPADPDAAGALHLEPGRFAFMLDRDTHWQVGFAIAPGSYQQIRAQGIENLRLSIPEIIPWLADRIDTLQDWKQVTLLSVQASRLHQWYRPGLLFIGDAAHTMNPVGGFGINLAVQDAVATANILTQPLKEGKVQVTELAKVQRERELPTKIIQKIQTKLQGKIHSQALDTDKPVQMPPFVRIIRSLPVLRNVQPHLVAFGIRTTRLKL